MRRQHWLFLEPYYGGSHRHLVDGLTQRMPLEARLWTLPARKWKWRMRGSSLHFAHRWANELPRVDGLFATSFVPVSELLGLLPAGTPRPRVVLYFHENQLSYPRGPDAPEDPRDFHFGWSQAVSAAAADVVLWNSAYNRDTFLDNLAALVARLPDERPAWLVETVRQRSHVVPVPVDVAALRQTTRPERNGPARIVWNHRWEHDKGPELFFEALKQLSAQEVPFEVSVLGRSFRDEPAVFQAAREFLGSRVRHWGYLENPDEYRRELAQADIAVSTAVHEFQGLSVLEAAAAGAVPLVPDALSYREIWPDCLRYPVGSLVEALRQRLTDLQRWRRFDPGPLVVPYSWEALLPRFQGLLDPASLEVAP